MEKPMLVNKGRPKNCEGREAKEIRTYDFLDSLGIEYYRVDHEHLDTMEQCEAVDVALETVLPAIKTGFKSAAGVKTPVLPT